MACMAKYLMEPLVRIGFVYYLMEKAKFFFEQ